MTHSDLYNDDGSLRFTHLPTWALDSLIAYEASIASGKVTFNDSSFADFDGDDWWLHDHIAAHLASLDYETHREASPGPGDGSQWTTGRSGPRSSGTTETG